MDLEDYKIFPAVHSEFDSYPITLIDFKRHLDSDKALNKVVTKGVDGRPEVSKYYLDGVWVAEIEFFFTNNADNLMTHRREVLRYIANDDSKSEDVVIKDKEFDFTNSVDLEQVIRERQQARESMIIEIKGFITGVMQSLLGYTMTQVITEAKSFWSQYDTDISNFIEFGSEDFKTNILAIDLNTSQFGWLSTMVDPQGTTVKDYIYNRLNY